MTSDQQEAQAATITTPTDREIRVDRVFGAPRDRVFAIYERCASTTTST